MRIFAILLSLVISGCSSGPVTPALSQTQSINDAALNRLTGEELAFEDWLAAFRIYALTQGISADTFDMAMADVKLKPEVRQANDNQPEFERQIWVYVDGAASDYRIKKGRELIAVNQSLFAEMNSAYGVPREVITAIWGMESAFGAVMGDVSVFDAATTLAYRTRRSKFGVNQLLAALRILEEGYATKEQMIGSWAGGMGQTQFIPSTFLQYAVDHNKDGRINLWSDLQDVFASTSNHLVQSGWRKNESWGREVVLPANFDYSLADKTIVKSVSQWMQLGIKGIPGSNLEADENISASLLIPAGHTGPAFLTYGNFKSILAYNNSTSYALGIGHLADRLGGGGRFHGDWPVDEPPLAKTEREDLQKSLIQLGYEVGKIDGIVGANTRAALRLYQKDKSLPADGFATKSLLALLREDATKASSRQ